jgi:hypothetical protein
MYLIVMKNGSHNDKRPGASITEMPCYSNGRRFSTTFSSRCFSSIKRDPTPAVSGSERPSFARVTRDQIGLQHIFFPLFTTFFASSAPSRVVIGSLSISEVGFYLDNAEFDALNCIIVEISG